MQTRIKQALFAILTTFIVVVILFSCKKDTDVNTDTFEIIKEYEKITVGTTTATISGTFDYSGRINSLKVRVSQSEQLFGSEEYVTELSGKAYSVNITGLKPGTLYHYRYEVDYGANEDYLTEIDEFTTLSESPTVKTLEVLPLDSTTVRVKCEVVSGGGLEVTERGVCWSMSHEPTINSNHASSGNGTGTFTVNMTELVAGTTYYVRAYATNNAGTAYGSEITFTTLQPVSLPTVTTSPVMNITHNSAQGGGNVTSDGGASVTERGLCWSTSHEPTTNGSHVSSGIGTGSFTVSMTNLMANTVYYVRAYAINSQGISYGDEVMFETDLAPLTSLLL